MRKDLALDALQRVVDRLRVAAELVGHVLVGRALQIEAQGIRLERREARAEAEDQALQLLGRDHDEWRLVHRWARQRVAGRGIALAVLPRRCVAEREQRVERRVLEPGGSLVRGDEVARYTEPGGAAAGVVLV